MDNLQSGLSLLQVEYDLELELHQTTDRRIRTLKELKDMLDKDPAHPRVLALMRVAADAREDQTKACKDLIAIRKIAGKRKVLGNRVD